MLKVNQIEIARGEFAIHVDLELELGRKYGIIGPSGAGKSTIFLALAGLIPTTTGSITLNDTRVDQLPPARRPFALMFQEHNLFTHLSVLDNLRLVNNDHAKIADVLASLDLDRHVNHRPQKLSGGQKARAAFARNLINPKAIKLYDEPFSAVGPAQRKIMQNMIETEQSESNATSLVIAHNIADLEGWVDEIIWVGKTISGPHEPANFFKNPTPEAMLYL